jgi:hypothetical protein
MRKFKSRSFVYDALFVIVVMIAAMASASWRPVPSWAVAVDRSRADGAFDVAECRSAGGRGLVGRRRVAQRGCAGLRALSG